jgi:hypothetical protein
MKKNLIKKIRQNIKDYSILLMLNNFALIHEDLLSNLGYIASSSFARMIGTKILSQNNDFIKKYNIRTIIKIKEIKVGLINK